MGILQARLERERSRMEKSSQAQEEHELSALRTTSDTQEAGGDLGMGFKKKYEKTHRNLDITS